MHLPRVLLTGGAGFIGSHVASRLIRRGRTPVILDDLSSGKRENLAHLDGFELHIGDAGDPGLLDSLLPGVEAVIHLAAVPSVALSVEKPLETHQANYVATLTLLEAMRRAGVRRLAYASSAAVYSPAVQTAHREDELPDPTSPYGVDKLAGEYILRAYRRMHGLRPTAMRFFNVYGERQDPKSPYSGVISIFADRIVSGQPLAVNGDGTQTRDFVYVGDLASVVVAQALADDGPDLLNIGTGRSSSLLDLVAALERSSGKPADLSFGPERPGDIRHSLASIERLRQAMPDFVPTTTLDEGLRRLLGR